jgi:hypothetical protein
MSNPIERQQAQTQKRDLEGVGEEAYMELLDATGWKFGETPTWSRHMGEPFLTSDELQELKDDLDRVLANPKRYKPEYIEMTPRYLRWEADLMEKMNEGVRNGTMQDEGDCIAIREEAAKVYREYAEKFESLSHF